MRPILFALAVLSLSAQDERAFAESMARLERQDPAAAKDLEDGSPLRLAAMALDPARAREEVRLAAATWLWAANLVRGLHPGKGRSPLQAARSQPDLLKAWALLEGVDGTRVPARDGLRLELAWRLRDLDRMRAAYAAVAARPSPTVRELAHRFFVAAHLGDWEGMKAEARALKAQGGRLEALHAAALADLAMFDYESLLKAVEEGHPAPPTAPLAACSYRISKWRVRVTGVTGTNKAFTQAAEGWPKGWVDRADPAIDLLQVGAAAHWLESAAQPPLSGFLDATRLYLVGYRDSPGGSGDAGRQEQVWDMRPEPGHPGRWHGLNTLTARIAGADPDKGPALQVTFEVEWDLRPAETYPETPAGAPAPAPKQPS